MKPKRTVLKNGLRVIAVPMKNNPTVTALVLVEAGSHYEKKEQNGISHFLEHMCFKGTANRPSPSAISTELDNYGAQSNAFTWYEFTGYYAKASAKHFHNIFDVIADLYANPTVPDEELQKEKGVIIEEINMYEDLPMRKVGEVLDTTMYGDQPAGRSVLGTKDIIRNMKREEFLAYRAKHYVPEKTVVIVAGNVDAADVFKKAKEAFGHVPPKRGPKKPAVKRTQKEPAVGVQHKDSSQVHLQLAFPTVAAKHKDTPAIHVLETILGRGMSSRLFRKLREEMGVCYYVRAETESYSDHGRFTVSAGVDIARTELVIEAIVHELRTVRDELVTEKELRKAKEFLLGNTALGLESSDSLAEHYGMQEILRLPLETPGEYTKKIRAVTPNDVRRVAKKIFQGAQANLAIVGPVKDTKRLTKLIQV